MATTADMQERIAALARELAEEMSDVDASDALSGLDAIETRAIEITNALTAELVKQQSAARPAEADESICPECGQQGRYEGRQERPLLTRRGPTTIVEPKYYCPCCRKDFFPADEMDRG